MIRAAHSCKCENNNLRPGYLRSAVVVFTGITWPAAACHLLLFHFRRKHHVHLLAVEPGHRLHFGELFEIGGKAQQQDFALLLEDDRTAAEEDVSLDLGALFQKVLSVFELEVVVVIVGLGAETNLLDDHLHLLGLDLLGLFLLLVQELLVVCDAADGGIGLGRNLDQVEFHLVGHAQCIAGGHDDRLLDVVAHQTHLRCRDLVVDAMGILLLRRTAQTARPRRTIPVPLIIPRASGSRSEWTCRVYSSVLLIWLIKVLFNGRFPASAEFAQTRLCRGSAKTVYFSILLASISAFTSPTM